MQTTLKALTEEVRQELGRDPSRSSAEDLINEAGARWVNAHRWSYLRQRTQEIALQSGTESYRLGAGVRSVGDTLHRPNTTWAPLRVVTFDEYTRFRERFLAGIERPFHPLAATSWDVKEGDKRRTLYLHVFPTGLTETVVAQLDVGWVPLDDLDDVADVPPPLVPFFIEWVRMYAQHREQPEVGYYGQFVTGPSFMDAKRLDSQHSGAIRMRPGRAGRYYNEARQPLTGARYEAMRHYYERGFHLQEGGFDG